jgi:flagellar basal-body rod protein FlgB
MKIASLKAEWASVRQAAIAGNIANADTPDYKARDIEPFSVQRQETRLRLAATRPNHMQLSPLGLQANEVDEVSGWEVAHSANTVSIDEQLMKSGETERHHTMSLSVLRTFHRMILQSVAFR